MVPRSQESDGLPSPEMPPLRLHGLMLLVTIGVMRAFQNQAVHTIVVQVIKNIFAHCRSIYKSRPLLFCNLLLQHSLDVLDVRNRGSLELEDLSLDSASVCCPGSDCMAISSLDFSSSSRPASGDAGGTASAPRPHVHPPTPLAMPCTPLNGPHGDLQSLLKWSSRDSP